MLDKISGLDPTRVGFQGEKSSVSYDIHNMSPREMDAMTLDMFNNGTITLKERLPFVPLETPAGERLEYYSIVWDDPDRKRDMLLEFRNILKEQVRDDDSPMNISVTRDAIALLERLEKHSTFESVLKDQINKNA